VSGAFMVIPRSVFLSVGGFDTNFFLYCEDEDLCRRIKHKGFDIVFDPSFEVIHKVEGSRATQTFSKGQLERFRSNIYYLLKWNGLMPAIVLNMFYLITFVIKGLFFTLRFNFKTARANFRYVVKLAQWRSFRHRKN
jgi:GT2 family glycosyltransferase